MKKLEFKIGEEKRRLEEYRASLSKLVNNMPIWVSEDGQYELIFKKNPKK